MTFILILMRLKHVLSILNINRDNVTSVCLDGAATGKGMEIFPFLAQKNIRSEIADEVWASCSLFQLNKDLFAFSYKSSQSRSCT